MNDISDVDAAYIAGIIDGEGCIAVRRWKTKQHRRGFVFTTAVRVGMTDEKLIQWMASITGMGRVQFGSPRKNPNHRPVWVWTVCGEQAAHLALVVYPFLKLKVEHARNLILAQAILSEGTTWISDEDFAIRQSYYEKSRDLNRRGAAALQPIIKPYYHETTPYALIDAGAI